jgi:hypothetical protein
VKTFEESLKENTDAMAAVIESRVNKMFTQEGRALFTTRLSVLDEFPTFTGTI